MTVTGPIAPSGLSCVRSIVGKVVYALATPTNIHKSQLAPQLSVLGLFLGFVSTIIASSHGKVGSQADNRYSVYLFKSKYARLNLQNIGFLGASAVGTWTAILPAIIDEIQRKTEEGTHQAPLFFLIRFSPLRDEVNMRSGTEFTRRSIKHARDSRMKGSLKKPSPRGGRLGLGGYPKLTTLGWTTYHH